MRFALTSGEKVLRHHLPNLFVIKPDGAFLRQALRTKNDDGPPGYDQAAQRRISVVGILDDDPVDTT